jgi:Uma2 family endonuclease
VSTPFPIDVATTRSAVLDPPLTDAELEALAIASDWFRLERTREGKILMHPPTGFLTSDGNSEITSQLRIWWKTHRLGRVIDSNGTFFLADSSMLSPDASYILPNRLKGLTKDKLTGFPRLCPDFVVELLSISDSLAKAQEKMERWIENGVTLGWLIDPYNKKVYVYVSGSETAIETGNTVRGQGPVEGFTLDLDELWRCYEV